ncbi:MAG: rhombosortase [Piscinibacter sp.]|nr:rhombosortase [Piscinibacter sp.]
MSAAGPGARAWLALAALFAAAALLAWPVAPERLDWQPALAAREPWRAFSAAAVHYSALHLAANLAGVALVGALGLVAEVPWRSTLAWLAAWPLTQLGLLLRPELAHYGGLSGVLHAGVAVAALHLVVAGPGRRRLVGGAILLGLLLKVLSETPWGPVLQHRPGWDIAIAPFSHASGALAGLLCALVALTLRPRSR